MEGKWMTASEVDDSESPDITQDSSNSNILFFF